MATAHSDIKKKPDYYSTIKDLKSHEWDVIVIGSGMGGMTSAAALAKCGKRVLVLEQHYVPGGFTHTFSRKGYTWDVGVHCLGQMSERELPGRIIKWLTNSHVDMCSMGDVYEIFNYPDDFKISFPATRMAFVHALEDKFPNEKATISRYMDLVREAALTSRFFFLTRVMPSWAKPINQVLIAKGRHFWSRTTKQVLDELTDNERLKAVLCGMWGYYGSPPSRSSFAIHALVTKHYLNGGYYPKGGASTIAEGFLRTVQSAGGQTVVRAYVEELLMEGGKTVGVRLKGGEELRAKKVISAVGAKATVERLVPQKYKDTSWGKGISALNQSPSYLCLYLGFEGDIKSAGATLANQWYMESWDMEWKEWDLNDPKSIAPVLYVSFPSLKDPAHDAGTTQRHTGEVVTFVPWGAFEKWKTTRRGFRDADYAAFKKDIEDRMIAQLRRHVPKIMDLVKYHELSTPLSAQYFTQAPQGAIYGLEATPERFLSPHIRTRTPIKNLYMAGGDIATLGITGALFGGFLAASTIEPKLISKILK